MLEYLDYQMFIRLCNITVYLLCAGKYAGQWAADTNDHGVISYDRDMIKSLPLGMSL